MSVSVAELFPGVGSVTGELVLDGVPYTVVGVAPPGFSLAGDVDVLTTLGRNTEPRMRNREARFLHVVGRLEPAATLSEAQAELAVIAALVRLHGDPEPTARRS